MKTHYCLQERDWITFEGTCNWCGAKEEDVPPAMTDEEFRAMMQKIEGNARPDITDD